MSIIKWVGGLFAGKKQSDTETGFRSSIETRQRAYYDYLLLDYDFISVVQDVRRMDARDGRVKRIHNRVARDVTRGGLILKQSDGDETVKREWQDYVRRLELSNPSKLKSDARGLLMEGNLPFQWVLDEQKNVVKGVRMPSDSIKVNAGENGQINNVASAYSQIDVLKNKKVADFALWQMTLARLDPDNYDDNLSLGRPFLDANREVWRKLRKTDTDLVVRRSSRSPMRLSHILEGATQDDLDKYKDEIEANKDLITTDFYMNKKGTVTALQGDASLGDINDVVYLLDTFFAGTPLPKGLMGYTDGLARDILEDLKTDYYEEVDQMQALLAWVYAQGFRLQLLLKNKNPDAYAFEIAFAERRTESRTQIADRALKMGALGYPRAMIYEEMGHNADDVEERKQQERKQGNPYPDFEQDHVPQPRVSITPNNGGKGNSATDIRMK